MIWIFIYQYEIQWHECPQGIYCTLLDCIGPRHDVCQLNQEKQIKTCPGLAKFESCLSKGKAEMATIWNSIVSNSYILWDAYGQNGNAY